MITTRTARLTTWGMALAVVASTTLTGCGSDEPTATPAATSDTTSAPTTEALPTTAAPLPTTQAPTSSVAAPVVDFVMPDLVGIDLQTAQNTIQTLGVFYTVSHDLFGSRNQVLDSNWIVCDQNVAAGQQVTGAAEGSIDFGVVKREETCP
ncbi:PASTA domain-containing protein [Klenkia brasiliensis]|uniref:PASTA domain-containing protein n=1 Tax=Klenkia brasiliensis TaxID=333142 RepID=A0A1G8A1J1_9ACTN|nr:PASTA domain-containing protein [Klenkia brasiliensis]SDH14778.1 PASTA domain-containing protein [Klenkia brasiliensis]